MCLILLRDPCLRDYTPVFSRYFSFSSVYYFTTMSISVIDPNFPLSNGITESSIGPDLWFLEIWSVAPGKVYERQRSEALFGGPPKGKFENPGFQIYIFLATEEITGKCKF